MFSVSRVKFSANIYELLPPDLPEVQGMDMLNRFFSRDGQLIVTIQSDESYSTEEGTAGLADHLRENAELVADVYRELTLDQLATEGGSLLAWLWLNSSPDDFSTIVEKLSPAQSEASIADAIELVQDDLFDERSIIRGYDPLGVTKLPGKLGETSVADADPMSSPDGKFRILYIEGNGVDFSDYRAASDWLAKIRENITQWEKKWNEGAPDSPPIKIGLTGTPAFMGEIGKEMEKDMTISVILTFVLISILFWVMHRRHKPLPWLVAAMFLILIITLNLAGLIFGNLSVMSAGFAAILMGLAVDYGIVLYHEAMDSEGSARELRKTVGPGILWAAATTAVVFLSLNLSSLPGISELGNLVAIGVAIGAFVMLWIFAPIAVQFRDLEKGILPVKQKPSKTPRRLAAILAFGIPAIALVSVIFQQIPHLQANFHPFRIKESPSMISWQRMQSELKGRENSVPLVMTGRSAKDLLKNADDAAVRLEVTRTGGMIEHYTMPNSMLPNPANQKANLDALRKLLPEKSRLIREIESAGFSEDGSRLTRQFFESWESYLEQIDSGRDFSLPVGKFSEWSIGRLFTEKEGTFAALGTAKPVDPDSRIWVEAICNTNTAAASLSSLGTALNERIRGDFFRVFLPMIGLLVIMLAIVFRNWRDLTLSILALLFASASMLILTVWTPLSWNSFNICGLPLLFGTGLDFSIHMIFALRRCEGDLLIARRGIGRALVFCGTSSAIGFGSLATASAYGLASLGLVCAVGILVNMFVAVWLLPLWHQWIHRNDS